MVDFDEIDYFIHAGLLYDLAGQMVRHLQGYVSEDQARSVLDRDRRLIAREIYAQMMAHFWEQATGYDVQASRGFSPSLNLATTLLQQAGRLIPSGKRCLCQVCIRQMLLGGFTRCLYPLQKFDSDTERRFAIIPERDALKWLKPAKEQFQIYYKPGTEQPGYILDFSAEIDSTVFIAGAKTRTDISAQEVEAKAAAVVRARLRSCCNRRK